MTMKGLAYKRMSWISSIKQVPSSEMPSTKTFQDVRETVALLDGRPQNRCCCGRFRVYGSDGVWSWVVAFANFLVNFIIVGLGRMSGILYVDFMDFFHIGRKTASIPFSVQQAGRNLFGPAAGILGQKYGIRFVTILGGVIGSLSAIIAYFKMDVTSITILWGLFFGISTALTTTLNQVSIDQYFERHRTTAGGFAFSGGCVGAIFFPVVLETLIHHYGMKGTFLVMGAIILNVIPAALLLVEPPWKQKDTTDNAYTQNIKQYGAFKVSKSAHREEKADRKLNEILETKPLSCSINFEILQANSDMVFQFLTMEISDGSVRSKINKNDLQKLDKVRLLNELECVYSEVANQEMNQKDHSVTSTSQDSKRSTQSLFKSKSERTVVRSIDANDKPLTRKAFNDIPRRIFIEHKLQELYGIKGTRIISHFPYPEQHRAWKILIELRKLCEKLTEKHSFQPMHNEAQIFASSERKDDDEPHIKMNTSKHSNSFCSHIKTAIKLHGNPLFLLICLCRGVFMLTFIPVVTVIVDFAMDKGLDKSDGKYIIAVLSLGDFLGRLGLGWITDRGYLSLPRYMLVGMIILAGSTASLPLMNSKLSILGSVLFFAILQGSLFVRHPMLVSQYVKSHEKSIGMGFINFLSGFLGFALPAFIGYFRDTLGSYDHMFYLNGIICAAIGLLWLLEPLLIRFSSSESEHS